MVRDKERRSAKSYDGVDMVLTRTETARQAGLRERQKVTALHGAAITGIRR